MTSIFDEKYQLSPPWKIFCRRSCNHVYLFLELRRFGWVARDCIVTSQTYSVCRRDHPACSCPDSDISAHVTRTRRRRSCSQDRQLSTHITHNDDVTSTGVTPYVDRIARTVNYDQHTSNTSHNSDVMSCLNAIKSNFTMQLKSKISNTALSFPSFR